MDSEGSYPTRQDNATSEITYPVREDGNDLNTEDVSDILDRLHIGTLRRDQLKRSRSTQNQDGEDNEPEMNDQELEEFYRKDRSHADRHDFQRQVSRSSRASRSSVGSTASGHSVDSGDPAYIRQSSSNGKRASRHSISIGTDTQDMGIQTTLSRGSTIPHTQSEDVSNKKERKSSKKDRMKSVFKRKSSTTENGSDSIEAPVLPTLPQGFIVKYMGRRPTKGLWGSKHTRAAVEDIVDSISKLPKDADLPLVNLDVYHQGLSMRPHSKNKIKCYKPVQIPIQFISYGLQDTVYSRIFCFIMVKEMSSQKKSLECHVYACDSSRSAKQVAACLAVAFKVYTERLQGGAFRFSVDIKMSDDKHDLESSCEA